MADGSTSQIIFFIAAVLVAASISSVFIGIGYDMSQRIDERGEAVKDQIETRISIINDPAAMPYDDGVLTIYVKNLSPDHIEKRIDIFVDGSLAGNYSLSIGLDDSRKWGPGVVQTVQLPIALAPGDHSLKVVLTNGVSATLDFRI